MLKSAFSRLIQLAIFALALYATYRLIQVHLDGPTYGLNWTQDYISSYAATLPDGAWQGIRDAMIATGLMVFGLAILVILHTSGHKLAILALSLCTLFSLYAVAYYPIERKVMPAPELSQFDKLWNAFMGIKPPPPVELPDRRLSTTLHQRAIEATLVFLFLWGALCLFKLHRHLTRKKLLGLWFTYGISFACFVYIGMNRDSSQIIGLAQRLGFFFIYVWVLMLTFLVPKVSHKKPFYPPLS